MIIEFFFLYMPEFFFFRIQSFFFLKKTRTPKWDAPYELLGDRPGPRNYCNKFLSFHTRQCLPQENFDKYFQGPFLGACENSVFSDYELLGDRPGPRKYCNKFLSFHTLQFY